MGLPVRRSSRAVMHAAASTAVTAGVAAVIAAVLGVAVGESFPYNRFPIVVGIYLLGVAVVLITPGIAGRVRTGLLSKDGDPLVDSA